MDRALTIRQAAEYLSVHPRTVYNLLHAGKLPGRKVGRVWRISAESLEAYLNTQPGKPGKDEDFTPEELEEEERAWREYLEGRDPGTPLEQVRLELLEGRNG